MKLDGSQVTSKHTFTSLTTEKMSFAIGIFINRLHHTCMPQPAIAAAAPEKEAESVHLVLRKRDARCDFLSR